MGLFSAIGSLARAFGTVAKAVGSVGKSAIGTVGKAIGTAGKAIVSVGKTIGKAVSYAGKEVWRGVRYVGKKVWSVVSFVGNLGSIVDIGNQIWEYFRPKQPGKPAGNNLVIKARDLNIVWGDDPRYWGWNTAQETSSGTVDTAELITVQALDVKANFDTRNLSPGISYDVVFLIKLKDDASGWEKPVNLGLGFPNGEKKELVYQFSQIKLTNEWLEIPVGEFITSSENKGMMEISLCGSELINEKKGIVIAGVVIRPKK